MFTLLSPQRLHTGMTTTLLPGVLLANYWSSLPWPLVFPLLCLSFSTQSDFNPFFLPIKFQLNSLDQVSHLLPNTHTDPHRCQNLSLHTRPCLSTLSVWQLLATFCILFQLMVYPPQNTKDIFVVFLDNVVYFLKNLFLLYWSIAS